MTSFVPVLGYVVLAVTVGAVILLIAGAVLINSVEKKGHDGL